MQEKENILRIFKETKQAIKDKNTTKLKDLSNQTIHSASLTQDPSNIAVAVIVYAIGKIIERKDYSLRPGWKKFYNSLLLDIDLVIDSLEKNDDIKLTKDLEILNKRLNSVSGKLSFYVKDVFEKAKINKASRLYEHGISLAQTAKLLGVSLWDLSSYTGQTGISEVPLGKTMDVKARIKLATDFLK